MPSPRLLPALLALVIAAAGCGGGAQAVRAPDGVLEVTLTDFRIEPMRVEADRRRLVVRATNSGRLPHNLEIRGPGGRTRLRISTLLPGESASARVRLPRGEWVMVCAVGHHEELGQHAELVVG